MLISLAILAAAPTAAVPNEKPSDPIVCTVQHTGDEVGTRIQPKKICMKKSERDQIQKFTSEQALQFINNGRNLGQASAGLELGRAGGSGR